MGKTSLGSSLLYTWDMSCTNLVQWRLERDILSKRAGFIDQSVDIRETFGFASPAEVLRAVELYGGSHYGSMLWELDSKAAHQYYNAWNTCVKLAWQVPRATHTYFVDQ